MKLATLRTAERDGALVLVDRSLSVCTPVSAIASTLQSALDRWDAVEPALAAVAAELEAGRARDARRFDTALCLAPLPRAYQWIDGSAYLNHVELVRRARGAPLPDSLRTDPLLYQGGSDDLLAATADVPFVSEAHGIDLEAEVAVITDDVPIGTGAADAAGHIRLIVLVNDWSLRNLVPAELAKGFGFYQSKPATGFSPVAVTPEELGSAWVGCKLHRPLVTHVNGAWLGDPDAGVDMAFSFADLIAHAACTRRLGAGTIVGSGTVSNRDPRRGSACLAEKRLLEQLATGSPATPFLRFGDRVRIEMTDPAGDSIFGAIDQRVVPLPPAAPGPNRDPRPKAPGPIR